MAANEKRGRRRGPVPQRDVRGLGAAACRPPNPRKTDPQQPAPLAFRDGKAPCLAAPGHVAQAAADREMTKWLQMKSAGAGGARPAAGYARLGRGSLPPAGSGGKRALSSPRSWLFEMGKRLVWLRRSHVTQAAADREMAKWPQTKSAGAGEALSRSGMCAAWARQLAARRTREKRALSGPRPWFLGMGKRLVWLRRGTSRRRLRTGKWQNGRKRKARAQEGPRLTAGCARLGRGSLPPKQLPVKAADFSFTAGNLAEALNPFFIFDKIQEGKSKQRPLSCKRN